MSSASPHRTGRPRGGFSPTINWGLARELFDEGGRPLSEIAARVGTTKQNLHKHARRFGWSERRAEGRGGAPFPAPVSATRLAVGGGAVNCAPRAETQSRSPEAILMAYIELFADAIEKGSVRHDCVADLDKAVRLLQFVRGQAESIKSTHATISLELMQSRHRELRAQMAATLDDDVAGVIGRAQSTDATEK
jgi:hypothetical protein